MDENNKPKPSARNGVRKTQKGSSAASKRTGPGQVPGEAGISSKIQKNDLLRRAKALSALQKTLLEITMHRPLPDLLHLIVERAAKLLNASSGGLYLTEPEKQRVRCVISYNTKADFSGTYLAYGEGAAGIVAKTGKPLNIKNYSTWPGRAKVYDQGSPFQAVISAPIIWEGQVKGVLHVLREKPFTKFELDLLLLFANHAAVAVENARLYDSVDQELSERRRAEKALRASEKEYRGLFEHMVEGFAYCQMIFKDEAPVDWIYLAVNTAFATLTGLKNVAGKRVREIIPNIREADPELFDVYGRVAKNGGQEKFEIYLNSLKMWFSVSVYSPEKDHFVAIFDVITQRKEAEAKLNQRLLEFKALYENGLSISSLRDPHEIGRLLMETLVQHLSWHHIAIRLTKPDSDALELVAFHQPNMTSEDRPAVAKKFTSLIHKTGQGLSGWAVQTGRIIRTGNVHEYPQYVETYPGIRSGLYVPLMAGERIIGVISVESEKADVFTDQDERLLATLAAQAATSFENARLYQDIQQELAERKQAQAALRDSEEKYRTLIEQLPALVYVDKMDGKGTSLFISPQVESVLGVSSEEWLNGDIAVWEDLIHPEDRERAVQAYLAMNQPGQMYDSEYRMISRDGHLVWMQDKGKVLIDSLGNPILHGVMFDVTERKQAEQSLRNSETMYRRAIEVAGAVPYYQTYSSDGIKLHYEFIGDGIREITGYGPEEFSAVLWDEMTLEVRLVDELAGYSFKEAFQLVRNGLSPIWKCEHRIRARDGSIHWVFESAVELRDEKGISHGSIGLFQDITERKRAEDELKENQNRLLESQNVARIGHYVLDIVSGIWTSSDTLNEIFGIDTNYVCDIEGWNRLIHPDQQRDMLTYFQEHVIAKRQPFDTEYRIQRANDHAIRWVHGMGKLEYSPEGDPIRMFGTIQDITERKHAETLQASIYKIARASMTTQSLDELYAKIHEILQDLIPTQFFYIAHYDREKDILSFPYFQDVYDTASPPGKPGRGLTEYVLRTRQALLATRDDVAQLVERGEVELIGADSIEWLGVPLIAHDEAIGVMVVQSYEKEIHFSEQDVDVMTYVSTQVASAIERKHAEQALKESEERFHSLFDNATVGMYRTTPKGRIILCNPAAVRMLGYSSFDELAQRDLEKEGFEPNYSRQMFHERMKNEGTIIGMESAWTRKDGSVMYVRESATAVRDEDGNVLYYDGTFEDITAHKLAERLLWESQERYRTLFEDSPVPLLEEDFSTAKRMLDELQANGVNDLRAYFQEHPEEIKRCVDGVRVVNGNKAVVNWFEAKTIADMQTTLGNLLDPGEYASILDEVLALYENGKHYEIAIHRSNQSGRSIYLIINGTVAPSYESTWERVLVSILDITNLKQAEDALKRSEAFTRSIVENEPECVKILKPGGILDYMNPAGLAMIEVSDLETVRGRSIYSSVAPDHRQAFIDLTERVLRGESGSLQFKMTGSKGTTRWLDTHAVPLYDEHGNVESLLGITRDITERKQAEALQDAVYRITNAAETTRSLNDLFPQIHKIISSVMNAENFFITLYDEARNLLEFPYFKDELDEPFMDQIEPGKGLTAYVLRTGKSLLCTQEVHDELERQGAVKLLGVPSKIWLGVPLMLEGKAIGVMVVQHYSDPDAYTQREQHILEFVSSQIAIAIRRKQAEDAIRASEERYRSLFAGMLDGVYRSTHNGKFVDVNPAMVRLFGYDSKEEMLEIDIKKDLYFAPGERESLFLDNGQEKVDIFRMKRKDGSEIWVEDHGRYIHDEQGNVIYHEGILRDVSERIRSEGEINRLLQESQQRLRHVEALHSIDLAIGSSMDLRTTLNILLSYIKSLLGVDAANILLFNTHSQSFEFAASTGYRTRVMESGMLPMGHSLAGRVALERRVLQFNDSPDLLTDREFHNTWRNEGFASYTGIPLIAKGELKGVLEVYHRGAFQADAQWMDLLQNFSTQAAIAVDNAQLFNDLQRSNFELSLAYDATIEGWSRALELRDYETEGHAQRITDLTLELARVFGLRDAEMVHLRRGALLHDIGKMGIPDSILLKTGPLTEEEWRVIRLHPVYAHELLSQISYLKPAIDIPYCHHEKWDGTGYPRGLRGEEIPPAARIFAVLDVYDSLTNERPYRKAWSRSEALAHIESISGTHLDPKVVKGFLQMVADGQLNI